MRARRIEDISNHHRDAASTARGTTRRAPEARVRVEAKGKTDSLEVVRHLANLAESYFVRKARPPRARQRCLGGRKASRRQNTVVVSSATTSSTSGLPLLEGMLVPTSAGMRGVIDAARGRRTLLTEREGGARRRGRGAHRRARGEAVRGGGPVEPRSDWSYRLLARDLTRSDRITPGKVASSSSRMPSACS